MRKRLTLAAVTTVLAAGLVFPSLAIAGGDQVNRPDDSGVSERQANGEVPVWAPREEQSARP